MSQTLNLPNFSDNNIFQNTQTQLSADAPPSSSALTVVNAANFISGFLLVGVPGSDVGELLAVNNTTSGTSLTLNSVTTNLQHYQQELVTALFGDQIRIYRVQDAGLGQQPPDSAFNYGTPYATVTIDAQNDSTQYTDPSGSGEYWYKATYYNSVTHNETALSGSRAVRGSFTVAYCSLAEIRREAGFTYAAYVKNDQIDEKRQAAQDEINGALDEFYQTPLQPPINDFLKGICISLAAGLLRQAQFSSIQNPSVNGDKMYKNAQDRLQMLVMKQRVLVNKQGQSLDGPGASGGVEGWPNQTTSTAAGSQGGAPRVFRMSDIQGQPLTVDPSGNPVGNLYYGRKW